MNRLQRSFYEKDFRPGFLSNDPVEVGDETRFVTVMFYELADSVDDDPAATEHIRRLVRTYPSGIVFPRFIVADTYFLEGDFAAGYEALGRRIPMPTYLNLAGPLHHPRLLPETLFDWSGSHITKRGIRGIDEIFDGLERTLDEFHEVHGMSVMEDFWRRLTADVDLEDIASSIEDEVINMYSGPEVRVILEAATARADHDPADAFSTYEAARRPIEWPEPWVYPGGYYPLLYAKCRQMFRAAENAYRANEGIPLVGQGWVSELTLFRELQAAFPDERIVHQGRPYWLERQTLDIFFPDRMVGVEYQGVQHTRPIDFFGGAEAFERQQERDGRKRALCREYGCELITVHPGYNLAAVIEAVSAALARDGL